MSASCGALAQLGERGLCKPEVRGSIPLSSTIMILFGPQGPFILPGFDTMHDADALEAGAL